eukprot:scaffold16847_cov66-Attheya_sp.AAC.3
MVVESLLENAIQDFNEELFVPEGDSVLALEEANVNGKRPYLHGGVFNEHHIVWDNGLWLVVLPPLGRCWGEGHIVVRYGDVLDYHAYFVHALRACRRCITEPLAENDLVSRGQVDRRVSGLRLGVLGGDIRPSCRNSAGVGLAGGCRKQSILEVILFSLLGCWCLGGTVLGDGGWEPVRRFFRCGRGRWVLARVGVGCTVAHRGRLRGGWGRVLLYPARRGVIDIHVVRIR